MKASTRLTLITLIALTVTACGQRGALYLPGTPDPAEQETATSTDADDDEGEDEGRR